MKNILLATLIALTLAACGGGDTPDPVNPPIENPGTPETIYKYTGKYLSCDGGVQTKLIINDKNATTLSLALSYKVYQYGNCSGEVRGEAIYPIHLEFTNTSTAYNYVYNYKDTTEYAKLDIDIGKLTIPMQVVEVSGAASYTSNSGDACLRVNNIDSICFNASKADVSTAAFARNGKEFYFPLRMINNSWMYSDIFYKQ